VADRFREHRHRGAAGDHRQQIVPAAAHPAGVFIDQFAHWNAELFLDIARLVHMSGDAEYFRTRVVLPSERAEPGGTATHDGGGDGDALDVVHRRGTAIQTDTGREWRLQPRHALLAFQALDQSGFLAADIGAGAAMRDDFEIVTGTAGVLADQAGIVRLIDRGLKHPAFITELAAD